MIYILEDVERWECDYRSCDGMCCVEGLQVTPADIKRISKLVGDWREFASFDEEEMIFKLNGKDNKCIFLDTDLSCKINQTKPLICQLLPFKIVDVIYSDEPIMKLKPMEVCPRYGKGPLLDNKFRERIESVAMQFLRENQKMIRDLNRASLDEIIGGL
jgi:Fe-S-cluster containining protein